MNTRPATWDVEFLKERESDAHEIALKALIDADERTERAISNALGEFRGCPSVKCRRARRCAGDTPLCRQSSRIRIQPAAERELIEDIYASLQEDRRDDAEADARAGASAFSLAPLAGRGW